MNVLKNITVSVCVLSVICTVLMMLVPDRFRREIRSVIALITAVSIGAMLLGADFSDISSGLGSISFDAGLSYNDRLVQNELESKISEYAIAFLSDKGVECKKVEVRTTIDEQRCISITEADLILDKRYSERESFIRAIIEEKIGEIDVKISYEEN